MEIKAGLGAMQIQLQDLAERSLEVRQADLRETMHALARLSPLNQVQNERQHIDALLERGTSAAGYSLQLLHSRLEGNMQHLRSVNPQAVLERGFALVFNQEGELVKRARQASAGMAIHVKLQDGTIDAHVDEVNK